MAWSSKTGQTTYHICLKIKSSTQPYTGTFCQSRHLMSWYDKTNPTKMSSELILYFLQWLRQLIHFEAGAGRKTSLTVNLRGKVAYNRNKSPTPTTVKTMRTHGNEHTCTHKGRTQEHCLLWQIQSGQLRISRTTMELKLPFKKKHSSFVRVLKNEVPR